MKKTFYKLLLVLFISLGTFAVSSPADAYYCRGWHCHHHYYRHHCRWVGGYWRYGYWHHSHRVCW
ncbi:MAG: hypothetical protein ACYCQI_09760 [Gammaproteobacteria bacterium]